MVRRKPIGISSRLGYNKSSLLNNIIESEDMIQQINALRDVYAQKAYNSYNADMYPTVVNTQPIIIEPTIYPTKEVALSGNTSKSKKIKYDGNKDKFINDIYNSYYRAVRPGASSDRDADRQARFLTQKAAFETGYGRSIANTHNYGGHRNKSGWLAFNSMDDFTKRDVALLDRKWGNWRTANNETDFVNAITTNRGAGAYAPRGEYQGYIGMNNDINQRLNMNRRRLRCGGQVNRPKAFLGAVIGAFGNIAGSLIQGSQQEELARKQQEAEDRRYYSQLASNMSNILNNRDAQEAYERQFRMAYENGGGIKVTDGGYKIPIGKNTFLLRGGKHEDINETGQGGIGMKIGGKVVEGENNEVVQKTPNEVRIFSDSIGIDGYSFAELARMGYNKDKLFNIQQSMNGDYGTDIARNGVRLSLPVGRTKAEIGLRAALRRAYNRVRNSWIGDAWRLANRNVAGNSAGNDIVLENGRVVHIPGTQGGAPNVLPGRAGGFRPTNVKNAVNATRQLANKVTQSVRRSTPVNTAKAVTRQPRTLNAPKGDVVNSAKQQVKGYNWPKNEPFQQTGYPNTHISVDPNKVNPYTGTIPFYTVGDAFRSYPLTALAAAGTTGGLAIGGNYLLDNMNNETDNVPVNTNNKSYQYWKGRDGKTYYGYITPGEKGNTYNIVGTVKDNQNNNNRSYVYGSARGQNSAPYSAIQIGLGSPSLGSYNVNIPSIDGVAFDSDFNSNNESTTVSTGTQSQPSRGAAVSTGRRTLASRGAAPAQTTLTPRTLASPIGPQPYYPDDEIIKEAYKDNELWEGAEQNNINFYEDDDVDTFVPVEERNGNNLGAIFKGADWAQLGADAIGSLSGLLANLNAADNIVMPREPAPIQAVKLPTTYSIGADLADNNRTTNEMLKDARNNMSSSAGLGSMRNRIRLASSDRVNSLNQTKSRAENEMLTADANNQQNVGIMNARLNADYKARLNEAQNRRALLRGNAYSTMLSGLSDAFGNFIDQGKQRYSDQQAMNWYTALLPEEGKNWIRSFLRRGGRIR